MIFKEGISVNSEDYFVDCWSDQMVFSCNPPHQQDVISGALKDVQKRIRLVSCFQKVAHV